jgi:NRAMP (natural resistance-associated macrophage protein)-like metal ion transporter
MNVKHSRAQADLAANPAPERDRSGESGLLKSLGVGVITGAADDDPSAIGTYASAGAKFGLAFLWIAPVVLPMMYSVVYLSAKLGQVYGKGLFAAIRDYYPRWVLYTTLAGAVVGNIIEAAADLGGVCASLQPLLPVPLPLIVVAVAATIFAFQLFGSYSLLRTLFRWLALALFAYVAAAVLAKPDPAEVLRKTFIPHIEFTEEFLSVVVACIGTSLSAYVYTWQSNQEVEEKIAQGRRRLQDRKGATRSDLRRTRRDVVIGMTFSNVILYCIILATGATLNPAGIHDIQTAAQAAQALSPLAGRAAGLLFALGVVGVGFLAIPIMTTGAAYDLVQAFGEKGSLHARPSESKLFYAAIATVTALAIGLNFLGFNPMKALVWSGVVQGFSVPPLLFLIMRLTNDPRVMGNRANSRVANLLGWTTTLVTFIATMALVATWLI